MLLTTPRTPLDVNWEVRDLLKTASRQAASYLGQIRATEALLEARKFDAFNRMSAFVVHDLKNLVAQLSLMLKNFERHAGNPEFQRDMLSTVEHVVGRMNGLMLQLRTGTTPVENARSIDLGAILQRICAAKSGSGVPVDAELTPGVFAIGHEDRLEHVIGHLIQNAIDASSTGSHVSVRLGHDGNFAVLEVIDTGVGMSAEFVRERLFKPFQTTKSEGMGIGVYESSQYVAGLGGQITRGKHAGDRHARTRPAAFGKPCGCGISRAEGGRVSAAGSSRWAMSRADPPLRAAARADAAEIPVCWSYWLNSAVANEFCIGQQQ